jgi:glutaredoxin
MFASRRLLKPCRITLFTRTGCGLCSQGRSVLSDVWDQRPFKYDEVDVDAKDQKHWRDVYDFDVPVIHISKDTAPDEDVAKVGKATKLMHRFTIEQITAKMDEVEQK